MTAVAPWTVWSIWRGDRATLGLVARVVEQGLSESTRGPSVTVWVLEDVERHSSFADFARDAPTQTTQLFDALRIRAAGREGRVTVTLRARGKGRHALAGREGIELVVAQAGPEFDPWSRATMGRVERAGTRGCLQWRWARAVPLIGRLTNYQPTRSTDPGAPATAALALEHRNDNRKWLLWGWTAVIAFIVPFLVYAMARPVWKAGGLEIAAVVVGAAAIASLLALIPALRDVVLPAVEIAERTPGRRALARLVALAAPGAAVVAKLLS